MSNISCQILLNFVLKYFNAFGGFGKNIFQSIFFIVLMTSSILSTAIPEIIYVIYAPDWDNALQVLAYPLECVCVYIKIMIFFTHRNTILKLLKDIDDVPEKFVTNAEGSAIMKEAKKTCIKPLTIYLYAVSSVMLVMYISSIPTQTYPFKMDYGVTAKWSNPWYWITWLYSCCSAIHGAVSSIMLDTLMAGMFCGICMRVQALQMYLSKIGKRNEERGREFFELFDKSYVNDGITEFQTLIRLTKTTEQAFSSIIFTQILFSTVVICTALYQLASVNLFHDPDKLFIYFGFINSMVCQLYIDINFANNIVHESSRLLLFVGSSDWFNLSMKNRKQLILMQTGMVSGLKIKSAGWISLNLRLFSGIIEQSYKSYICLRDINRKF